MYLKCKHNFNVIIIIDSGNFKYVISDIVPGWKFPVLLSVLSKTNDVHA